MILWIFNHYAVAPDMSGGTRHYDLASELVQRGYKVAIFASSFHHGSRREMKLTSGERWKVEDINGVKFVWIKTFPYQYNNWRRMLNMVSYMLRAWRIGRKLTRLSPDIERPDVIIGSSVHPLAVLAAVWIAKHYGASFIVEVRDLWPQTLVDMGILSDHHPLKYILALLEKYFYKRADRIITLPPKAVDYIIKLDIDPQKIVWIPNGVNLDRFTKVNDLYQQGNSDVFKIMYVGSHGPSSGLETLLKAAKILQNNGYNDINFILVGDGSEKAKLIEMKDKMNLNNVKFCDPVPKNDIPRKLLQADALLHIELEFMCSKYGGSPNKIFDYMGAGKPIIYASNFVKDMLDEIGCGIYVAPGDYQALANAIIQLYKMPVEKRMEIGLKGKEYVMQYHDIPVLADKLESCINLNS